MAKRYDIETTALSAPRGTPEVISLPISGPVVIPGGGLLSEAVYARLDGDLLIELADGTRLVVEGYFDAATPPALATEAGAHIGADVVGALAGVDAMTAQQPGPVAAPIGRVETVEGEAVIVRADGARLDAEVGTLIARGDRIETGADGSAGFLFADEGTFAVGGHARAIFDDLVFDPDTATAHATFVVQEGPFSFAGGGISALDGAFVIKTPAASLDIDGASGAGRVEADGATSVTYLRADDAADGVIKVYNPGGTQLLDQSYEALTVEDFFQAPSNVFRLGPRDAAEHFGNALSALPDAHAVMPSTLLTVERAQPAPSPFDDDAPDDAPEVAVGPVDLSDEIQVDRDTAFEIAARKAAIARSARDAADEALSDAAAAEKAARAQALEAETRADESADTVEDLRAQALKILEQSDQRDKAFEDAVRQADSAAVQEESAARGVAEIDLAEAQVAERLAAAEEAVRQALAAAEQARAEALEILAEAQQKEEAFAAAQQAAQEAKADEDAQALAVAEADAAEEAAAAALRAAEAVAEASARDAIAAERVAQEASTAAEVVETVVARELAAIDPDLLKPPSPDDPSSARGNWITQVRASMDVASAALAQGEDAARAAYRDALREGSSIEEALERAIVAAEAYGGAASADRVLAGGPDGLIDENEVADGPILIAGGDGGFSGGSGDAGAIGSDVLIGSGGEDGLAGGAGFGSGGIDGVFGFGFSFTPIVLRSNKSTLDDDDRDEAVSLTATVTSSQADQKIGTSLADFLVGGNAATTTGGLEGNDFLYGDTPTNYLSGTHNAGNALLNPTFAAGDADTMSGGAGDDILWGGDGDDTLYGDVPADTSAFAFSLGATTAGNDTLHGGDGDDFLDGGGGNDQLEGDAGDDNIFGYAGDDVLLGGAGVDTLSGGTGADQFEFSGGTGADALAHATSLGTDIISDYNASENDLFMLSDADFSLGNAGTLTDGTNYFEADTTTINAGVQNLSGGTANAGIVIIGAATGGTGTEVWYTDDASAMSTSNSYQIADVTGADRATIEAGDFNLKT
tara:strand:- start:381948 stop:385070 length:3123 start_codon:yes stop_codon:yes gene_type:complete